MLHGLVDPADVRRPAARLHRRPLLSGGHRPGRGNGPRRVGVRPGGGGHRPRTVSLRPGRPRTEGGRVGDPRPIGVRIARRGRGRGRPPTEGIGANRRRLVRPGGPRRGRSRGSGLPSTWPRLPGNARIDRRGRRRRPTGCDTGRLGRLPGRRRGTDLRRGPQVERRVRRTRTRGRTTVRIGREGAGGRRPGTAVRGGRRQQRPGPVRSRLVPVPTRPRPRGNRPPLASSGRRNGRPPSRPAPNVLSRLRAGPVARPRTTVPTRNRRRTPTRPGHTGRPGDRSRRRVRRRRE